MKFIVLIVAVLGLLWWLRRGRNTRADGSDSMGTAAPPLEMVACAQCGVHLPSDEALPGRGGVFCTEAHRTAFEARPSAP